MADDKDFRHQVLRGLWQDLKDHLERGAIIVVAPDLDLADVADGVNKDRVAIVQDWIVQNQIAKPTASQVSTWNEMPTKEFSFIIAQPYVLIQETGH